MGASPAILFATFKGAGGAPATPTVLSVTPTTATGAAGTTYNAAMPATVNAGDMLITIIHIGSSTAGVPTVTTPGGWSAGYSQAGSSSRQLLFYLTAAGTEGGTTVAYANTAGTRFVAHTYRIAAGSFSGTPAANSGTGASSATWDPPSRASGSGGAVLFIAVGSANLGTTVFSWSLPSNQNDDSTGSPAATLATSTDISTGTLDPGAYTMNGAAAHIVATVSLLSI